MPVEMTYTIDQLRSAVIADYAHLCHDGVEDDELTLEEFTEQAQTMTWTQLMEETSLLDHDDVAALDDYMSLWLPKAIA